MVIHNNSRESYALLDRESRQEVILAVFGESGRPLSDRMVAEELGFVDMNRVRPRITELVKSGRLVELRRKHYDEQTQRNVRLCALVDDDDDE